MSDPVLTNETQFECIYQVEEDTLIRAIQECNLLLPDGDVTSGRLTGRVRKFKLYSNVGVTTCVLEDQEVKLVGLTTPVRLCCCEKGATVVIDGVNHTLYGLEEKLLWEITITKNNPGLPGNPPEPEVAPAIVSEPVPDPVTDPIVDPVTNSTSVP